MTKHGRIEAALFLGAFVLATAPIRSQPAQSTNRIVPLIVMDDVSLTDAIASLAKMAGINYILDPKLAESRLRVSGRWENRTAPQMLDALLKQHRLSMVENP